MPTLLNYTLIAAEHATEELTTTVGVSVGKERKGRVFI